MTQVIKFSNQISQNGNNFYSFIQIRALRMQSNITKSTSIRSCVYFVGFLCVILLVDREVTTDASAFKWFFNKIYIKFARKVIYLCLSQCVRIIKTILNCTHHKWNKTENIKRRKMPFIALENIVLCNCIVCISSVLPGDLLQTEKYIFFNSMGWVMFKFA